MPDGPRRNRMRRSPSRRSISLKSCRVIRATRFLIVLRSKGRELSDASLATTFPLPGTGAFAFRFRSCSATRSRSHVDGGPVLAHAGQHLAAVRGDQHIIFNATAAPAGQIDSGLHREHHAGLQDVRGVRSHCRSFMYLQPQSVAQSMGEILPVAGPGDKFPRSSIHVARLDSWPYRPKGLLLSAEHDVIDLLKLVCRAAFSRGPGERQILTGQKNTCQVAFVEALARPPVH